MVRKWHVDQALYSARSMMSVINELSMEELEAALAIESASQRRKVVIRRLIGRAARINEQQFINQLKEKYHYGS